MEVVKEAYERADLTVECVIAHEVRTISASWAYLNQIPWDDILSVAFWRSQGAFQRCYLRDLAHSSGKISILGPVMEAQAMVQPISTRVHVLLPPPNPVRSNTN